MPRRYTLGKRADEQAATRARIVAAALVVFRDQGAHAATPPVIARAADVSAGTVRNHFPGRDDLAHAVADAILDEIRVPGLEIFAGLDSVVARVERLAHELAAFSVRGEAWWRVQQSDPELITVWAGHDQRVAARLDALVAAAVGPDETDPSVAAVVRTTVGSPMFYALRGAGLTPDEAVEVELALLRPWLRARASDRAGRGKRPRSVPPSSGG